jgi:glutamate racemase
MKNTLAIYDIGVGGLSLIEPIRNMLPELGISYICDEEAFVFDSSTGFHQIQDRCKKACEAAFNMGCKLIILGAHTLTLSSILELQQRWIQTEHQSEGRSVLGLHLPLKAELFDPQWHLRNELGIFLMSHAAIRTGYYQQECLRNGFNNTLFVPADLLNTAIEFGDKLSIQTALRQVLEPFKEILPKVTYVVPTSTHFDFIEQELRSLFTQDVKIIIPNKGMAHNIVKYIYKHPEYKVDNGPVYYYTTGNCHDFKLKILKYTGVETDVTQISI